MLVVASARSDKKRRIYHKSGCMYAKRIREENCIKMGVDFAKKKKYKECKFCAGIKGDVRVHKEAFEEMNDKKKMQFMYVTKTQTLYMNTEIGFWKMFYSREVGGYILYHRNAYNNGMTFWNAANGDFHRQKDVKATESMDDIIEYILKHDRAMEIIKDDYRKLPKSTKKEKKYYRAAKKRSERNAARRLDSLFSMIERKEGIRQLSYC